MSGPDRRRKRPILLACILGSAAAFLGIAISAGLAFAGGAVSLAAIRNPRRVVLAEACPGGAICGASEDVGAPSTAVAADALAQSGTEREIAARS